MPDHPGNLARFSAALAQHETSRNLMNVVKAAALACDLAVLVLCFFLGRLPSLFLDNISIGHALFGWAMTNGWVRIIEFATVSLAMVCWLGGYLGHYTRLRCKPWWDEMHELVFAIAASAMADAMFAFFGKWELSRLWVGATWLFVLFLLPVARWLLRNWLLRLPWARIPYVLIGSPEAASNTQAAIASEPLMGLDLVGFISIVPLSAAELPPELREIPSINLTDKLIDFLQKPGGYVVALAVDDANNEDLRHLAGVLINTRDDVIVIPPLSGLPLLGMEFSHFFRHEFLLMRPRNNLNRRSLQAIKRTIDLVGSVTLLVLLAPLFLAVIIAIRRNSPGPVFFIQERVGRNGKTFPLYKFRSMIMNADSVLDGWKRSQSPLWERYRISNFKLADDPRITGVGRWIRRMSIDELPQLWNIVRGDMSLVGPRPLLARELENYGNDIATYYRVRPGLTGLWQISGRSDTSFADRISMDRWYIRNWSLWYDIVILMRTIRVVMSGEGAH